MAISEQARNDLYNRLADVLGTGPAATLMSHLPPIGWADVATKQDLAGLGRELRLEMGKLGSDLRAEMSEMKGDLRAEIAQLGGALRGEIGGLRGEIGGLRGEMGLEFAKQSRTFVVALVMALATQSALFYGILELKV